MFKNKIENRICNLIKNLTKDFSLDTISKSPARFDIKKLDWFNKNYIQLLDLLEFNYRVAENKLLQYYILDQENYITENYILFIDIDLQLVFAYYLNDNLNSIDSNYNYIGGVDNSTNLINLINNQIPYNFKIDVTKFQKIVDYNLPVNFSNLENKSYNSRNIILYFYPIKKAELKEFEVKNVKNTFFKWYNLDEVISNNKFLSFPIWQNFCLNNKISIFEPNNKIINSYLSSILDKNRISVLSESGKESKVIFDYHLPSSDILKWKKNDIKKSLGCLKEITDFLDICWGKNEMQINDLHQELNYLVKSILQNPNIKIDIFLQKELEIQPFKKEDKVNIEYVYQILVKKYEQIIKDWLQQKNLSIGDYLWPLRVALSGEEKSASPFEILAILGPKTSKKRLEKVLKINF